MFICGKEGAMPLRRHRARRRATSWVGEASPAEHRLQTTSAVDDVAARASREQFLARAVVGGGALAAGGVLAGGLARLAASAPSVAQDRKILNFALLLEYIEAGFYSEALAKGNLSGELLEYATTVRNHERAHISFLKGALGKGARAEPKLDFGKTTSDPKKFTVAAVALEETMVAAYNGQAVNLTKPALAQAAKIVSVEARHAAWIRSLADKNPAPSATDKPKTAAQVEAEVNRTGFVQSE
jgi:Ferritin-like domain